MVVILKQKSKAQGGLKFDAQGVIKVISIRKQMKMNIIETLHYLSDRAQLNARFYAALSEEESSLPATDRDTYKCHAIIFQNAVNALEKMAKEIETLQASSR
jgi:hypothetical protein